jgi:hypothetical protein
MPALVPSHSERWALTDTGSVPMVRSRRSRVEGLCITVVTLSIALNATAAGAYEPTSPGYLEGAETAPPGPPPPASAPPEALPTSGVETPKGAPRVEKTQVVRYDRPGGMPIGPVADDRVAPRSRCDRPFTSTLLETGKVRIYATAKESEDHPEHRDPAIAGRPVFACLEATGKSRLLDLPEVGGEKRAYWVEVDDGVFAVSAPLVAYAYSQYYLDTHQTWVRVRNLRTGRVVRSCLVGGAIAPHPGPRVTDIVLSPDGEVGWNAQGERQITSEEFVSGCDPTE